MILMTREEETIFGDVDGHKARKRPRLEGMTRKKKTFSCCFAKAKAAVNHSGGGGSGCSSRSEWEPNSELKTCAKQLQQQ